MQNKAQHSERILSGWKEHDLVASELNTGLYLYLYYFIILIIIILIFYLIPRFVVRREMVANSFGALR